MQFRAAGITHLYRTEAGRRRTRDIAFGIVTDVHRLMRSHTERVGDRFERSPVGLWGPERTGNDSRIERLRPSEPTEFVALGLVGVGSLAGPLGAAALVVLPALVAVTVLAYLFFATPYLTSSSCATPGCSRAVTTWLFTCRPG